MGKVAKVPQAMPLVEEPAKLLESLHNCEGIDVIVCLIIVRVKMISHCQN